jgi:hypothetical protein
MKTIKQLILLKAKEAGATGFFRQGCRCSIRSFMSSDCNFADCVIVDKNSKVVEILESTAELKTFESHPSLLEYYAGLAFQSVMRKKIEPFQTPEIKQICSRAFDFAEAMVAEAERRTKPAQ